jgi:hypothetical protein
VPKAPAAPSFALREELHPFVHRLWLYAYGDRGAEQSRSAILFLARATELDQADCTHCTHASIAKGESGLPSDAGNDFNERMGIRSYRYPASVIVLKNPVYAD